MKHEVVNSLECFGVTRDPLTQDFAFVLHLTSNGCLRDYLKCASWESVPWCIRLQFLHRIANNLYTLHNLGGIHRDLHSGNILIQEHSDAYIADFGQAKYVICSSCSLCASGHSCGIIPYMAPELFECKPHTQASDIYSFGMLMWEISSSEQPFMDKEHDVSLLREIHKGFRPDIVPETPS